jgi:diguanylate cyclase (GGDEF)-like protein/PAS domain S-box-containing protein
MSYEYVSPSISKLTGYTIEEIKKIGLCSLVLETKLITDTIKEIHSYNELERIRANDDSSRWQADYLIKTKDGRKLWLADVSYPWFDNMGNIIGSIGSLRDIDTRIAAENNVKEELSRLAYTDPLTELANRRDFFRRMDQELKRLQRSESDLSMLLIDIDHFKSINDLYGHDVGDVLIKEIASLIRHCLRETDHPARLGGEEFGVLLPDTSAKGAYWVAERICKKVARNVFYADNDSKKPIKCSVSIGVTAVGLDETRDSTKLYKMADTRLYIAKNTGRNQVFAEDIVMAS